MPNINKLMLNNIFITMINEMNDEYLLLWSHIHISKYNGLRFTQILLKYT